MRLRMRVRSRAQYKSLTQHFLALARGFGRHMRSGNQITPQERGQSVCIQAIGFDLGIGYQSRFKRMSQHHLFHLLNLAQQIVNAAPVPARFQHHFALALQPAKKLSETKSCVAVNPASPKLPASLVYCNKHTVALVNINSNIVHDQQSPFGLALPHANTKLKLLSCYLTLFSPIRLRMRLGGIAAWTNGRIGFGSHHSQCALEQLVETI